MMLEKIKKSDEFTGEKDDMEILENAIKYLQDHDDTE